MRVQINLICKKTVLYATALWLLLLFGFGAGGLNARAARLQDTGEKLVVVIDPGHGGENLGTTENGYLEKSMDMTTALAMYEELNKFEGVEVYLTHTDDRDMSLKERAKFASKKKADLLISIHYNASLSHALYGSEVWISLEPYYHAYGYQFATVVMRGFQEMGMNLRGIKTRPDSKGTDYYGVIRESVALGVPAVIIEHCHVDHPKDSTNCDTQEKQQAFGVMDAHAVAKYYGLKSSALGVDYSDYPGTLPEISLTDLVPRTRYDDTPPELCKIEAQEIFYDEGRVLLAIRASDKNSNLIYYSYSLDGGETFQEMVPWPEGDLLTGEFENQFVLELQIPDGMKPQICLRAYNPYDLFTTSNILDFPQEFRKVEPTEEPTREPDIVFEDGTELLVPSVGSQEESPKQTVETLMQILKICIPIVLVIFLALLVFYVVNRSKGSEK